MSTRTFTFSVTAPPTLGWVPSSGQIRSLTGAYGGTVTTLQGASATINGVKQNIIYGLAAWCGMTYAPGLGAYGSLVLYLGGHGDYPYNEVYRFDVATRSWSQYSNPLGIAAVGGNHTVPLYEDAPWPTGYYVDPIYGEYYATSDLTTLRTGQVSADHTYGKTLWLPTGSIGPDPLGYYFNPSLTAAVPGGSRQSSWPHYVPLSNPVWTRGGAALARATDKGVGLYDSLRNRVVSIDSGDFNTTVCVWNCATQTASTFTMSAWVFPYYGTGAYDATNDLYMVAVNSDDYRANGYKIWLVNPTTGASKAATLSGADRPAIGAVGGWDWVPSWGAWVHYPGSGNIVYKVKRPADPWNGTWTVTSQQLTGDTPATVFAGNPHISRFRYIESAGCFLWLGSADQPVQAWNVTAP